MLAYVHGSSLCFRGVSCELLSFFLEHFLLLSLATGFCDFSVLQLLKFGIVRLKLPVL
jgi:hypothetical protein